LQLMHSQAGIPQGTKVDRVQACKEELDQLREKLEKAKLELAFYEDIFGVKFEEVTPGGEVYRLMTDDGEEKCLIERIRLE